MNGGALTESILELVQMEASLVALVLDGTGRILTANRYAKQLVGEDLSQRMLTDIIIDFTGTLKFPDLLHEMDRVHLLNVKTAQGLPQTLYFRFRKAGSEFLAMGETNSIEIETLRKGLVTANNELSNLGRELQKKNAELVKLNDHKNQLLGLVRASEERYRLVVENANEAIVVAQDGMCRFVNRVASEITGYGAEELLARPFLDFIHRDDRSMVMDFHLRRLRGETLTARYPFRLVGKDGDTRWVEVGAVLIEWEGRSATLNFLIDITDRNRAEEERARLEADNRQLQKAESLGRMAAAIAHNFNNMLGAVIGNLELALDDVPQGSELQTCISEAMKASHRAAEISRFMLTYLGQTAGKAEPIDPANAARETCALLDASIPANVQLKTELPPHGPIIHADGVHLKQVFTNLITNAVEAIGEREGEIALAIHVMAGTQVQESKLFPLGWEPKAKEYVCLSVGDNGCGVDAATLENIFDPFFSTKFAGRGLGLSVVLGLVRTYGGAIAVESHPGRGATFKVFFPKSEEETPLFARDEVPVTRCVAGGGLVLVVDDEPMVRNMAESMLKRRLGYEVVTAGDGYEAVEIFRARKDEISLVLLDLSMPGMNGWETLSALRALRHDIPVVLASGYDEAQVMQGDHPQRPQAFVHKPYLMADLREALAAAQGRASAQDRGDNREH
jgi:two-component system cell cycle sensor histidine kinase/response regulator CckA